MRTITLLFALFITTFTVAQENIAVATHFDTKLMFFGDGKSYDSGTLDLMVRAKFNGKQDEYGYFGVVAEYETAQLQHGYKRYSLGVGYTLNQYILEGLETSVYVNYGIISRQGATRGFGANAELGYKINDAIKFTLVVQAVDRKDLGVLYRKSEIRFSGMMGIEINLVDVSKLWGKW